MTVLVVERVTGHLRGTLTRWMFEVAPGVFVGSLSARVRSKLWALVQGRRRLGACTLIVRAANEQGFVVEATGDARRQVRDYDGLWLFSVADDAQPAPAATVSRAEVLRIAGDASVDPRTVAAFLAGKKVRPRAAERIARASRASR